MVGTAVTPPLFAPLTRAASAQTELQPTSVGSVNRAAAGGQASRIGKANRSDATRPGDRTTDTPAPQQRPAQGPASSPAPAPASIPRDSFEKSPDPTDASARRHQEIEDAASQPSNDIATQTAPTGEKLSAEEVEQVEQLQARDREVKAHEQAHKAAAGQYATSGPTYSYQRGPDGKRYAVGGSVGIDTSEAETPQKTITKMQVVRRAALAPAEPSAQDRKVAALASQQMSEARAELAEQRRAGHSGVTDAKQATNETSKAKPADEGEEVNDGVPAGGRDDASPSVDPVSPETPGGSPAGGTAMLRESGRVGAALDTFA